MVQINNISHHHIISSGFFPQTHLSSFSYPEPQHFLISLLWVRGESRSGSRLMLIMAEQTRFGFPATSRVSYVLSVCISLLLCGFFIWHFAAVFLYQLLKYSVICVSPLYVLLPKYFLDTNLF